MPVVLTVHDETVLELPDNGNSCVPRVEEIMCEPVDWAEKIQVPIQLERQESRDE
jgi:hypothetical protein